MSDAGPSTPSQPCWVELPPPIWSNIFTQLLYINQGTPADIWRRSAQAAYDYVQHPHYYPADLAALVSVSVVCKAFAQAMAQITALPGELRYLRDSTDILADSGRTAVAWDSRLLLSLSPMITKVLIDGGFKPGSGLPAFLARATQLEHVALMCREPLEAAFADYLLSACSTSSIRGLFVAASCLPTLYPSSLDTLHIQRFVSPDNKDWLDVLMYHLARLKRLRKLRITSHLPILRSTGMQLHPLEELWLDILVYTDRRYDLQWLTSQPCERLVVEVQLDSAASEDQTAMMAQLQQLDLHKLVVACQGEHNADLLPAWTHLDCSRVQHLELRLDRWSTNVPDSGCLEALVQIVQVWEHVVVDKLWLTEAWIVPWASLMGRARTLHIISLVPHGQEIVVTGFNRSAFDLQPAQQLVVSGGMLLHGLPAARDLDGTYTVQNKAFTDVK